MVRSVFVKSVDNFYKRKNDLLDIVTSASAVYGVYKAAKGIYKLDYKEFGFGVIISYLSKLYK